MGAWAILAFCIVAEVSATSLLTRSEGFARPVYGLLALVILGGCFWALSQVLTRIPMGVAYAIWSGAGIALICVAGWFFFRQPLTTMQVLCIGLVVVGAIGLSLSTNPA
ncbi:MAG: multidrug efflux SMR transporter [Pseudolabrys sp.]|jgi:small multidrug resistance pump